MGLKNCPECGRLFVDNASGMCPECYRQVEEDELLVVDYLRERRKASLQEIHEATGVKESTILRMLKRGRIFSGLEVSYPCETCGVPIYEGRLCPRCSKGFLEQVKTINTPQKPEEKQQSHRTHERMYTGNYNREKK